MPHQLRADARVGHATCTGFTCRVAVSQGTLRLIFCTHLETSSGLFTQDLMELLVMLVVGRCFCLWVVVGCCALRWCAVRCLTGLIRVKHAQASTYKCSRQGDTPTHDTTRIESQRHPGHAFLITVGKASSVC